MDAKAESVESIHSLADFRAPSEVYFLSMRLFDNKNKEVSNSFYWLSSKEDVPDFENSEWFYTPNKEYASFAQLKEMPKVDVESKTTISTNSATVTLTNKSDKIAFFMEMRVTGKDGNTVLPVVWSDNYVSLMPNESRTFEATFSGDVKKEDLAVVVKGFNVN